VRTVQRDMSMMQVISDICQADAFEAVWPTADIVLMNPPFRSWEGMNQQEREWVRQSTNELGRGRPDLSVGFIERGIQSLSPSGALATLVPAGVLASDSLSKWRNGLLQRVTPTLVAVLGEHGLFQHALVNVGMLALQNSPAMRKQLNVAWSSSESGAASLAIRAIRRSLFGSNEVDPLIKGSEWSVSVTNVETWKKRPSWLPGPGTLGSLLETIQGRIETKVEDVFLVRQGIRTGANDAFVQPVGVVEKLPARERRYFREAVDAASFVNGEIESQKYLFIPEHTWKTEAEVKEAVPEFFEQHLRHKKESLAERKSLKREPRRRHRWWELTWERAWTFDGRPRLLSKRFGLYPAFARDFEGRFAVVQANAWMPTRALSDRNDDAVRDGLTAYWWLLNSRIAVALFREYCPNVAGGQLDLEHKYVRHVPLPNLLRQFHENPAIQVLASSIRTRNPDRLPNLSERDQFAAAAFGTDVSEWNLSGLELPD